MNKSAILWSRMIDYALNHPEAPARLVMVSLSKEALTKLLTPSRVALLEELRDHEPASVKELAERLGRPVESVSRDLRILSNYGILEFVQTGKVKKPRITKDVLMVPLTA